MIHKKNFKLSKICNDRGNISYHLQVLKKHLLPCFYFTLALIAISYYYSNEIISLLLRPLIHAKGNIVSNAITEVFFVYLNLSISIGFIASIPFYLLQLYKFCSSGLKETEKKGVLFFLIFFVLLFGCGIIVLYKFVLPQSVLFLLKYQNSKVPNIIPNINIKIYLDFILQGMLSFGLAFQLPLILVLLAKARLIKVRSLKCFRKYFTIIALTISAIITPPDVASQIILTSILIFLYEITIILISRLNKKSQKQN